MGRPRAYILVVWMGLVLSLPLFGETGVSLTVFQPEGKDKFFVLPIVDGEPPQQALDRYVSTVHADPDLAKMTAKHWKSTDGTFTPFGTFTKDRPAVVLIANDGKRPQEAVKSFQHAGVKPMVLPVAAELNLPEPSQRQAFRELLARSADALVALGGNDIDPALYGEAPWDPNHKFNRTRDEAELALVRQYIATGKGRLYGICRGHQMISVALGFKLIQDLESEGVNGHKEGVHEVQLLGPRNTRLRTGLDGAKKAEVNTYHHQAVRYEDRKGIIVTAVAGSGPNRVVEALESSDGRIMTFQFHPERMEDEVGKAILNRMVKEVKRWWEHPETQRRRPACFPYMAALAPPALEQ